VKRPRIGTILNAVRNNEEIAIVRLKGELITTGMIVSVRELITKKGDKMAFVVLGDQHDTIEMVAFPSTYTPNKKNSSSLANAWRSKASSPSAMMNQVLRLIGSKHLYQ
jgi:DNA polymerase III alpha subunit